ncbi:MAG: hypothetical protein QM692_22235 [Thermomicrobiales bacterium]
MTTRAELRLALRLRLEDDAAAPLWPDDVLNDALAEAMNAYGAACPRQVTTGVTVTAGAQQAALSGEIDPTRITRVVDAAGIWVTPWVAEQDRPGERGQAWRVWAGQLRLAEPAAASIAGVWQIEHRAGRAAPANDVDPLDIVPGDESLVALLAEGAALARRAIEDAKRGLRSDAGARADAARRQAWQLRGSRLRLRG